MEAVNSSVNMIGHSTEDLAAHSQQLNASIEKLTATLDNLLRRNETVLGSLMDLMNVLIEKN